MIADSGRAPTRSWVLWGIGVLAYAVAVFNRSSLAVASLSAQRRFDASAGALSVFLFVQLAVYASMQVPVGLLADRFGSRRMLVTGAALMAAGQLTLATAHQIPVALAARVLVGGGDAMTFISVLRLIPGWFPASRVPLVSQLTAILGQLGQVAAAYPLVTLLRSAGWGPAFAGAASVTGGVGLLVAVALRSGAGEASPAAASVAPGRLRQELRDAWQEPGTRIGLWTHFTAMFSGAVFVLLWGYPFLVVGEGRSPTVAGVLLSLMVGVGAVTAFALGRLVGTWPLRRSAFTIAIVTASAAVWGVVLAWPGRAPLPLLVLLVVVLASNGPGSIVGFDYARTYNPSTRLGSANGIVNVGGFAATLIAIVAIGGILDATTTGGPANYTLHSFRWAFAAQYPLWIGGLAAVLHNRRLLRRRLADAGVRIDPLPRALARRVRGRRPPGQ
ncbi:MAG: MFS transporter [Mycobacteriales bacterium]